jgi:hypothetical protein
MESPSLDVRLNCAWKEWEGGWVLGRLLDDTGEREASGVTLINRRLREYLVC